MPKLTLKEFKEYLRTQSQEELVLEMEKLYKLYPEIQIYFQALLLPSGSDEQFAKTADIISKEFHFKGLPKNPDLRRIKKVIADFAKLQPSPVQLAKLYSKFAFELMDRTDGRPFQINNKIIVIVMDSVSRSGLQHVDGQGIWRLHLEFFGARRAGLQMTPVVVQTIPHLGAGLIPQNRATIQQSHVGAKIILNKAVFALFRNGKGKPDTFVPVNVIADVVAETVDLG